VIDAHVHVWDLAVRDQPWIPDGSPIRRTCTLADLHAVVGETPVERVVLVQVINDAGETADFLAAAADDDLVAGVVGWADLADPAFPAVLARLAAAGPLVGIRHQALAEADPAGWLTSPAVGRGLAELERAGLPFDLMLRPEHLGAAIAVARSHPSLTFVLDHLGKPPIAAGRLEPWASAVRELAAEPNVSCKLSGVHTIAAPGWRTADLAPFLDAALEAFGPDRLLFGSDWPVSAQAAPYRQVVETAEGAYRALSAAERAAVLGHNARRVYGLG
jgi:L-fuconolactonase